MLRSMDGNASVKRPRPMVEADRRMKKGHPLTYKQNSKIIKPQYVIERLFELTKHNAIVATDGSASNVCRSILQGHASRTWLTSAGLGRWDLSRRRSARKRLFLKSWCVHHQRGQLPDESPGDGNAVEHKLPVKIVLLNNGFHGMVRQWQDLFYEGRYSASYLENFLTSSNWRRPMTSWDCEREAPA